MAGRRDARAFASRPQQQRTVTRHTGTLLRLYSSAYKSRVDAAFEVTK